MTEQTTQFLKSGQRVKLADISFANYLVKDVEPDGIDSSLASLAFLKEEKTPVIKRNIWEAIITLFFEKAATKDELVLLVLRKDGNPNEQKLILPRQEVTGGSCDFDFNKHPRVLDVLTGEYYEDVMILFSEYSTLCTIHSHHTMKFYEPSTQDDKTELSHPGFYGIVSHIDLLKGTYRACFTLVVKDGESNSRRFFAESDNPLLIEGFTGQKDMSGSNTTVYFDKDLVVSPPRFQFLSKVKGKKGYSCSTLVDYADWELDSGYYCSDYDYLEDYYRALGAGTTPPTAPKSSAKELENTESAYYELLAIESVYGIDALRKAISRLSKGV